MSDGPHYSLTIILAASPLGWIGAHHYYVGNKRRSVLYTVFLITFIPTLLSLMDAFILIYRGRESFIRRHGTDKDLESYHLRELRKHNPILARQIAKNGEEYDLENIDEESVPNSATEFMRQKQKEVYDNEDQKEDRRTEPDYSDYYGDWD